MRRCRDEESPAGMLHSEPSLKILLVEDRDDDAQLVRRELLRTHDVPIDLRVVQTEPDFRDALGHFLPDAILADLTLPRFNGMQALEIAHALRPELPFIFVSGTLGEEHAIEALKRGASDYVLKHNLLRLAPALDRALAEARERAERRKTQALLDTTREQLDRVMASLQDVVWSVEWPSEQVLYISPGAEEVYGRKPEEFLAQPELWLHTIHPGDVDQVRENWRRIANGEPFDAEYRILRPDGSLRWVNDRAHLVYDATRRPARVDGIVRDITAEMEQRRRIARLSRMRELFAGVSSIVLRVHDRQEILDETTRMAVDVGRFRTAWIGLLDATSHRLYAAAGSGEHTDFLASIEISDDAGAESGSGIAGQSLRSGRVEIWNDVERDAIRARDALLAMKVLSCASFPLEVDGKLIGALILHAGEPGAFDAEEVRLLGDVVGNICFALELLARQDQIRYLASYDVLTGLASRALFEDRVRQAIEAARASGDLVALVQLDLQRFYAVNDSFGRHVGDHVLQQFAQRLREVGHGESRLARIAGDQFALFIPAVKDEAFVARAVEEVFTGVIAAPLSIFRRAPERHSIRMTARMRSSSSATPKRH